MVVNAFRFRALVLAAPSPAGQNGLDIAQAGADTWAHARLAAVERRASHRRVCMQTRWLVSAVLAAILLVGAAAQGAMAQTKFKAVATSRPTPHFELFTWFGEELDKRTKGQIKTDVVSLPELGLTGFELVRVTRAGLVDFADVILAYAAGEVPIIEGVDLPGLYPDLDRSVKAHDAFMAAVKKYEDKLGGIVLGGYIWPNQYLVSRKPVRGPEDLKGLKVRVYGAAQTELARTLGMEPVALAFAEVYTALERGTVDAAITGSYPAFAIKLFEVAKYIVDINHGPNSGALVVSKRTWDRATPEVRQILTALGTEFTQRGWEMGRRTTKEGIDKNREKGMEFVPLTPAMASAVRDTLSKVILPSWAKRTGADARPVFNQYLAPHAGLTLP
jgi:TRAP-type C4-dicarboxylate transport system substrate-binding protein